MYEPEHKLVYCYVLVFEEFTIWGQVSTYHKRVPVCNLKEWDLFGELFLKQVHLNSLL